MAMSENEKEIQPAQTTMVESQQERWLKYGGNVAVMVIAVILIAGLVIWCFQTPSLTARVDTTKAGLYSLKPQTVNIIGNNNQSIKIVSLYTPKKQSTTGAEEDFDSRTDATPEQAQAVTDLLDEYRRKGRKIDVEVIDPKLQETKVDDLVAEVRKRSAPEEKKYQAVVEEYPKIYSQIEKISAEELEKVRDALKKVEKIDDQDLAETLFLTIGTVQGLPPQLKKTKAEVDKQTQQKIPDYRAAVNIIDNGMSALSALAGRIVENFGTAKDNPKVPEQVRAYMKESTPRYQELKKIADDFSKTIRGLGEIKTSDLKQSLKDKNSILIMGESEWRILPYEKVWQEANVASAMMSEGKPRKKFAGEQQITSAILSLTNKVKPKVVFMRPGGPPLTTSGIPGFQRGGDFSLMADRLRDYNFEVLDKDITGMWAMQAQMRQQFAPPEPSDEDIKDAIWVVLAVPTGQPQMGMPPPTVGPKLADHLKAGGSALVPARPNGEPMTEALDEWGVKIYTDAVSVHEPVKTGGPRSDPVEDAQRSPFIFVLKEYGDHMLTKPLNSLPSILLFACPVELQPKAGYQSTRILPVPQILKTWGETNIDGAINGEKIEYDAPKGAAKSGDLPGPLYEGAVVDKGSGGRVVVLGCVQFLMDNILRNQALYDPNLAQQGIFVSRFPGNSELFLNSIFWLARQEPLISISPTAMEVSRIKEINKGALDFWRVGVLLILLPALVVAAGVVMFMKRRD